MHGSVSQSRAFQHPGYDAIGPLLGVGCLDIAVGKRQRLDQDPGSAAWSTLRLTTKSAVWRLSTS
jgi:hypothetical protein